MPLNGRRVTNNHTPLGSTMKVEPIRSLSAIARIRRRLQRSPRNLALFVVGINTAYRASELLSLRVGQVCHLRSGDVLEIKESKTRKFRAVTVNTPCCDAVQALIESRRNEKGPHWVHDDAFLFAGKHPDQPLTVSTLSRYVKAWCHEAGLKGNYASHSLRKTWGFMQRTRSTACVPLLMRAFGHASQQQTMAYLCIQDDEIAALYTELEL